MVDETICRAAHQAVPRAGVPAVSDHDQVEGPGQGELFQTIGSTTGHDPGVKHHPVLLGQLAGLFLDPAEVGVLPFLFVLHLIGSRWCNADTE